MGKEIRKLDGANMDIDLTSKAEDIHWKQDICPWNAVENTIAHKCAVKNTSICKYFCGIKALDTILWKPRQDRGNARVQYSLQQNKYPQMGEKASQAERASRP